VHEVDENKNYVIFGIIGGVVFAGIACYILMVCRDRHYKKLLPGAEKKL